MITEKTFSDTEGEILVSPRSKWVILMVHDADSKLLLTDVNFSSKAAIAASFICHDKNSMSLTISHSPFTPSPSKMRKEETISLSSTNVGLRNQTSDPSREGSIIIPELCSCSLKKKL